MSMMWTAIGTAAVGAGVSLYGANKQGQIAKDTNAANQANIDRSNNQEWNNYLLQRGVNTGGTAPYGTIPTNAPAVNTRLPLWANINLPPAPNAQMSPVPLFVKRS